MKFVVLQELGERWSWELRDADCRILAVSAMSFASREAVMESIRKFRIEAPRSPVGDVVAEQCRGTESRQGEGEPR